MPNVDHSRVGSVRAHLRRLEASQLKSYRLDTMQLTAKVIADTSADIICLQEVDNIGTLKAFEQDFLSDIPGGRYSQIHLIEGIDVALIARKRTSDGEVIEIIGARSHAEMGGVRDFVLLDETTSGFDPLTEQGFSQNLVARRPATDQWTLYYAREPSEDAVVRHLVQLDYILASPFLAGANLRAIPDIIRNDQPIRTIFPPGQEVERYARTGWDRPEASDHCPVAVTLEMI